LKHKHKLKRTSQCIEDSVPAFEVGSVASTVASGVKLYPPLFVADAPAPAPVPVTILIIVAPFLTKLNNQL
jgi:hypothetical protein